MKIEHINDPCKKYMGLCMNKSLIRVNMAHIHNDDEYEATIIHEVAHALIHFRHDKRYSHHEKEYQARLIEYNYCRSHDNSYTQSALKGLVYHRKALKAENINLRHLQIEAKSFYTKIVNTAPL